MACWRDRRGPCPAALDRRARLLLLVGHRITAASARRGKQAEPISPLALEAVQRIDAIFDLERALGVMVEALDLDGQKQIHEAEGMLAVCIQHEMDHLIGKVFVEYLSPLKRNRIKTKLIKQKKDEEREAVR